MEADVIRKALDAIQKATTSIDAQVDEINQHILETADEAQPSKRRGRGRKPAAADKSKGRGKGKAKDKTADDVREAVLRLIEDQDNDAAKDALGEAQEGAKKVSDLEPENYAAAIEACEAALDDNPTG